MNTYNTCIPLIFGVIIFWYVINQALKMIFRQKYTEFWPKFVQKFAPNLQSLAYIEIFNNCSKNGRTKCISNVNTSKNCPCIWLTNNLTLSLRGALWTVKHFYHKLNGTILIFVLTNLVWYKKSSCVFKLCFHINIKV